ncbi:site-specific DNA recombinase [Rhodopirellula rubra]|uniref:Site-specific DNA recombinase n=1 Tax=Aporhodopirellula rubra TaxID=980271 RepID=A0A7W5DWL6_9BACT|nr:recombinase family protein [Aporhodopirellula rubra]MBB3205408.1 site-specific DNA recombinase [Aporhodopirellula rubra]
MIAPSKEPTTIRCAIYTRKSTSEGLEQEFNSLDAQREAGSAYIASQRNEGWVEVETRYDDGGFSGGNIDRPALTRLMDDIKAGKIDCVIVYKVDRLSRSLMDFALIMKTFDDLHVSFVSVTQQFNTTSSMGRLTLNILFSFAQFEREIISERTRDKMAAARRKGKYLGGRPILGYDLDRENKKLVVNESEAERVRQIFELYLESEGLIGTIEGMRVRGWRTKLWITKSGKSIGGGPIYKNTLHTLLTNRMYLGKVTYHDEVHEGEHEAIVDEELFQAVQKKLRSNRINIGDRVHGRTQGVLTGLIRCVACDSAMTHTTSGGSGNGKRYRYYVCSKANRGGHKTCPRPSLPADQVEQFIVGQLQSLTIDKDLLEKTCLKVRKTVRNKGERLENELTALTLTLQNTERAIEAYATPTGDDKREPKRLDTLASLNEQVARDLRRRTELQQELNNIHTAAPDRHTIMSAIKDLQSLWEHLTNGERGRLISKLIERIDHDASDSTFAITLSPTGLKSFSAEHKSQQQEESR